MKNLLKRYLRETGGYIKIMTGLMLMPMLGATAVGVDMTEFYRVRTAFQTATDAGALAAAKQIMIGGTTAENVQLARDYGRDVFLANIGNLAAANPSIQFDDGNGDCAANGITASASIDHDMIFAGVYKFFKEKKGMMEGAADKVTMSTTSRVHCGGDTVEIALVLDNSGSMNDNGRLTALKTAARNMVNAMHDSIGQQSRPKPVQFSLVPFAGMVNVGPNNRNASWMDTSGEASYHHEHIDWPDNFTRNGRVVRNNGNQIMTRFTLYDAMNISWKGCVEQRPYPYNTNDEMSGVNNPDLKFVPSFAPDEPDDLSTDTSGKREYEFQDTSQTAIYCTWWYNYPYHNYCYRWHDPRRPNDVYYGYYNGTYNGQPGPGYANRYGGAYDAQGNFIGGSGLVQTSRDINEKRYLNNYLVDSHGNPDLAANGNILYTAQYSGSDAVQYERQRWTWKYFNQTPRDVNNNQSALPTVAGIQGGPNFYCTTQPLTPLTHNRDTALNAINGMIAEGATNIQQGIAWGWRSLSAQEPLTGGRDYNEADNKKVMVIMTDGNNTYYPYKDIATDNITRNPSIYASHGFNGGVYSDGAKPKRLFEGFDAIANPSDDFDTYRQAMDEHMVKTCENAKAAGIELYTISFDVPAGSSVETALKACASKGNDGEPFYYDVDGSGELIEAFKKITERIADLSIRF